MSQGEKELVQCYNMGCRSKFNPANNKEGSCRFHPGAPVFHDGLKEWSCCKKKFTDFTAFLDTPGCTLGPHNNVKQEPLLQQKKDLVEAGDTNIDAISNSISTVIKGPGPPPEPHERPSSDEPTIELKKIVNPSLAKAIQKHKGEVARTDSNESLTKPGTIKDGEACKNSGCGKVYNVNEVETDICRYHPGTPVFHEGMKYWSCCCRKTSDFSSFLSQVGCATSPNHLWVSSEDVAKETSENGDRPCRWDYFQTPSKISVNFYAKNASPDDCRIAVNRVKVEAKVSYDFGRSNFTLNLILWDEIDREKCHVNVGAAKTEIVLTKARPGSWAKLEYPVNLVGNGSVTEAMAQVNVNSVQGSD